MDNLFALIPILALSIPIIAIVTKAKQKRLETELQHGRSAAESSEARQMRSEIKELKDRIIILERIATDNNSAITLDREIESLRGPTN